MQEEIVAKVSRYLSVDPLQADNDIFAFIFAVFHKVELISSLAFTTQWSSRRACRAIGLIDAFNSYLEDK